MKFKIFIIIKIAIFALPLMVFPSKLHAAPKDSNNPNIILIMADDLGYETITANGGTSYKTPNLDKLASSGIRFTHCFATPACTPSRVQIMTGQYPFHNGWPDGIWARPRERQIVDPSLLTFAHILKKVGYATAVAGKWQLARFDDHPYHPIRLGFEEYCLWTWRYGNTRPSRYWKPFIWQNGKLNTEMQRNGVFGPDVYTDFIIDFIRRNKDLPFFAYYSMALPHRPFVNTPDNLNLVRKDDKQQLFSGMVAYMDKLIGRIVTTLNELGLREKTVIIFTGDNGTDRFIVSSMGGTNMRGGKGEMTDLGTHVPLIASWKGVIPEGLVCNDLIDFTDIFPTLADIAGIKVESKPNLDGSSFLPQLKGQKGNPRDWVFLQYGNEQAVRTRYWKLNNYGWIFNMKEDPFENHPIIRTRDTNESATARKNLERIAIKKNRH